jgi:predicted acyl esterase
MRRAATAEAGSTTATVKFFERGRARQEARMREGPYSVHVTGDVEVIMRDGVPLVTDVHRPVRDGEVVAGPLPVLLTRTPYNKDALAESPC